MQKRIVIPVVVFVLAFTGLIEYILLRLQAGLVQTQSGIETIAANLAVANGQLGTTNDQLSPIGKLNAVSDQMGLLVTHIRELQGQIDGFDTRFAALSGQIGELNTKIDKLNTRLNSVDQHVSHLDPQTLFGILPAR